MTAERTPDARVEAERRYPPSSERARGGDASAEVFIAGAEWALDVQREGLAERVAVALYRKTNYSPDYATDRARIASITAAVVAAIYGKRP